MNITGPLGRPIAVPSSADWERARVAHPSDWAVAYGRYRAGRLRSDARDRIDTWVDNYVRRRQRRLDLEWRGRQSPPPLEPVSDDEETEDEVDIHGVPVCRLPAAPSLFEDAVGPHVSIASSGDPAPLGSRFNPITVV